MQKRINLIDHWTDSPAGDVSPALEAIRIDASEAPVVPFTTDMTPVRLHYCEEPELRGYVRCNREEGDCALCDVGRSVEERALLPVYNPVTKAVCVLPVSPSARPGALRPLLMPVLRSRDRVALPLRKPDRAKLELRVVELRKGMDDGASTIAAFLARWEAGEVDLADVFPKHDNADLKAVPAVAELLKFRGAEL